MFSGFKTGYLAKKSEISQPRNKLCENFLEILVKENFVTSSHTDPLNLNNIIIKLKYVDGKPVMRSFKAITKPSKRVYVKAKDLWKFNTGTFTLIVSTHKGFMTDKECLKHNLGGELFCILH
jgi:small subunit ribosomal protein S8